MILVCLAMDMVVKYSDSCLPGLGYGDKIQ